MRACENCEWWERDPQRVEQPTEWGMCRESPQWVTRTADHWCGRFRAAERLAGGKDARK